MSIPAAFAERTLAREGSRGRAWLDRLPGLVTRLLARWRLEPVGGLVFGSVALVIPVRRGTEDAVLKVSFPHPGNAGEWSALAAFGGHGAVRLLAADPPSFAMLLERTHREDLTSVHDVGEALRVAGRVSRRLAIPAPPGTEHLSDAATRWGTELWARHSATDPGERLPEPTVETAIRGFEVLAADTTPTMVHGDLHLANILRAEREDWLAIDPKGLAGSACFDAASAVRVGLVGFAAEPRLRDLLTGRVAAFSHAAALDPTFSIALTQARFTSSYYWDLVMGSHPAVVAGMRAAAIATTGPGNAA